MELENLSIEKHEVFIEPNGEVNEEKSVSMMLYDVRQMIKEIDNHTKKSRYKSLAVIALEEVENWMQKELNTE